MQYTYVCGTIADLCTLLSTYESPLLMLFFPYNRPPKKEEEERIQMYNNINLK